MLLVAVLLCGVGTRKPGSTLHELHVAGMRDEGQHFLERLCQSQVPGCRSNPAHMPINSCFVDKGIASRQVVSTTTTSCLSQARPCLRHLWRNGPKRATHAWLHAPLEPRSGEDCDDCKLLFGTSSSRSQWPWRQHFSTQPTRRPRPSTTPHGDSRTQAPRRYWWHVWLGFAGDSAPRAVFFSLRQARDALHHGRYAPGKLDYLGDDSLFFLRSLVSGSQCSVLLPEEYVRQFFWETTSGVVSVFSAILVDSGYMFWPVYGAFLEKFTRVPREGGLRIDSTRWVG